MSEYIDECPDYNVTNKTSFEALEDVKIAPNFMGGNRKYLCFTQSSSPFLKDIALIEKDLKRLVNFDKLLKKYEIKSIEELEEIIADYDDMCKDIVEMTFREKVEIR